MSFLLVMCLKHINYTGFSIITHGQNNSRVGTYRQNYAICRNRNRKLFNRWTMVGNIFYFKSAAGCVHVNKLSAKKRKNKAKWYILQKGWNIHHWISVGIILPNRIVRCSAVHSLLNLFHFNSTDVSGWIGKVSQNLKTFPLYNFLFVGLVSICFMLNEDSPMPSAASRAADLVV